MANRLHHKKTLMRSTSAQICMLVDYMASHKDLANSGGQYSGAMGHIKANEEWEALRAMLRGYGGDKSVLQWRQTWRDLKRKARNVLKDNKEGQIPIVTDIIYKVLDTISPPGEECIVHIQDTTKSVAMEDIDWAMGNDDSNLLDNQAAGEEQKTSQNNEGSSETEDEDVNDPASLVQVLVPEPQTKEDPAKASVKPQNDHAYILDPLQAPVVGIPRPPRLTAKPRRRSPTASRSRSPHSPSASRRRLRTPVRDKRAPSIDARRRQVLLARRRKQQNMIHQASNDFVALEHSRLKMEEERDRRLHDREMERLKLELQRIEVQRNHNELLQHIVNIAQNAYELLQRNVQ